MMRRDGLLLLGRVLGAAIFLQSGFAKLMAPAATKAYFAQVHIPMVDIAYWVAVAGELFGGVGLFLGLLTPAAALVLAAYCVATAMMVQMDWRDAAKVIHFKKNLAMAGGYLAFVVTGSGRYGMDALLFRRR